MDLWLVLYRGGPIGIGMFFIGLGVLFMGIAKLSQTGKKQNHLAHPIYSSRWALTEFFSSRRK